MPSNHTCSFRLGQVERAIHHRISTSLLPRHWLPNGLHLVLSFNFISNFSDPPVGRFHSFKDNTRHFVSNCGDYPAACHGLQTPCWPDFTKGLRIATVDDTALLGLKMRSIASTSMNSRSSRAHTVFPAMKLCNGPPKLLLPYFLSSGLTQPP